MKNTNKSKYKSNISEIWKSTSLQTNKAMLQWADIDILTPTAVWATSTNEPPYVDKNRHR